MDAQTIEMLKVVLPDAIKILGPALITGIVAYLTVKIQYKSKIKEITENQNFKAKEHLLDYYKKKIKDAGAAANDLNHILGFALGSSTAVNLSNHESDEKYEVDEIVPQISLVDMYLELCDFEIKTTLRDMESVKLENSEEYKKLKEYQEQSKLLKPSHESNILKSNILKLVEIYTFIARCSQFVLESQIRKLFGNVVENA